MTEFKVGDKVRCINANEVEATLTKGNTYEVKNVECHFVSLRADDGTTRPYFPRRFELVYEPQVGDKVKHTYSSGTEVTGVISGFDAGGVGYSSEGLGLYSPSIPHKTVLLERPEPKVPTEYLSVVQHKKFPELFVLVRVREGNNIFQWLGQTEPYDARRWFQDCEVQALLDTGDWEVRK